MDSLLLPSSEKKVVEALIRSHAFPLSARDEAELKGKGLVILLHGSPGSGKTMTGGTVPPPLVLSFSLPPSLPYLIQAPAPFPSSSYTQTYPC